MNHNVAAVLSRVLLDVCIVLISARILGHLALKLRQPPVVGEIVAGVALGPSLLGLLPGHLDKVLFPADVLLQLNILAQLGLVLFMFIVGLEMNMAVVRGRESVVGAISFASTIVPFGLGALLALLLYPRHQSVAGHAVSELDMVLFLGIAMSITAFPVLARILSDRQIQGTQIGAFALASAAIGDVIAWTLLALVVAVIRGSSLLGVLRIVALTAVFAVTMYSVGRRQALRLDDWYHRAGKLTPDMLAVVLVGAVISAWITDKIGIHPIFGAFIFGRILPHSDRFVRDILGRLQQVSVILLLPLFFVVTGLSVNIRGLSASDWVQLSAIVGVAIGGKFLGAYGAARLSRLPRRHSLIIAVLINTRGLTELVILTVGKELGILDDEMFSMMVLMALVTTAMTGPLMDILYPNRPSRSRRRAFSPRWLRRRLTLARRLWSNTERCHQYLDAVTPDAIEKLHGGHRHAPPKAL
ncbi:cation:proton antiporter [Mycobacterium heidelbergense]|uniref:cation:proton antiporter domain-containing protein n=1 Tax=Mycobacterium heidelbergense TaxID=53376 RepID=UPI003CFA3C5C